MNGLVDDWIDLGRFGVLLFFLISGFVIPFSLKGPQALRDFVVSRICRLYPAFWVSVLAVVAVAIVVGRPVASPSTVAANLTMVPNLLGRDYVNGVYWTLWIELLFYGACAGLFAVGLLRRIDAIFVVALGLVAIPLGGIALRHMGHHVPVLYVAAHLSLLFAGYLLRQAFLNEHRRAGLYAAIVTAAALVEIPILASLPERRFTISTPLGVTVAAITALLLFLAANRGRWSPPRWLLWSGAISYSVYLLHVPCAYVMMAIVPPTSVGAGLVFYVLAFALTILTSSAAYVWIEKPAITLGRRIIHARRETLAMEVAP